MNPRDRIKQLQAALARAEDELSTSRVYLNELHGGHDKAVEELAALRARVAEQSAAPLPMREDPRYRGTDFRSAIDVNRASQEGSK